MWRFIGFRSIPIMKFYAVHAGRNPGVYNSWKECEQQVKNFSAAKYKKFSTLSEAELFVQKGCCEINKSRFSTENDTKQAELGEKELLSKSTQSFKRPAEENKHISSYKVTKYDDSVASKNEKENRLVVYTDGACSNNGRSSCSAGYGVWWGKGHDLNMSRKLDGIQTNQRAEIAAISAAIQQAIDNDYKKILIKTDSKFVISCLTEWSSSWKRHGWLKSDGKPVVHKEQFIEILNNMKLIDVKFEHVLGHSGVHGNEMADQLAVAGSKM